MSARIYEVLDQVIARVGLPENTATVAAARKLYDERRGRVFEDEDLWEAWTQAFLEWYVLEHVPEGESRPFASRDASELSQEDAQPLRDWLRSQRTLGQITARKDDGVHVLDLIGGAQFRVTEQRALFGVRPGDVAEIRLVACGDDVRFGRTFCFHPSGTRGAIVRRIEELRERGMPREQMLDHFARLRIRCERYSHLAPAKIYQSTDDHVPEGGMRL